GTAQVHAIKQRGKDHIVAEGEWDATKDHAWFVGFAPAPKPRIVVAALVEHGGLGARAAAPIVMQVIQGYFEKVAPGEKPAPAHVRLPSPPAPRLSPTPIPITSAAEPADDEPGLVGD